MNEIKIEDLNTELNMDIVEERECLTYQEAKEFKKLFSKCMKSYKSKEIGVSDKKWLKNLFKEELPEITEDELETSSSEIVEAIGEFDTNLASINKSIEQGVSKESWLADKFQESAVGMSINEYGKNLQRMDDFLSQKNTEIHEALLRNSDGQIKMSRNLDGNIAENMIAKSTELSGFLQGKDIKVEVRDVFTSNSVDVRATNLKTGEYQNYQMKFGKDAKATIDLIKGGNYGNQRLVVPTEQLKEVQAAFPTRGLANISLNHTNRKY
jgi:hypothetical protein